MQMHFQLFVALNEVCLSVLVGRFDDILLCKMFWGIIS